MPDCSQWHFLWIYWFLRKPLFKEMKYIYIFFEMYYVCRISDIINSMTAIIVHIEPSNPSAAAPTNKVVLSSQSWTSLWVFSNPAASHMIPISVLGPRVDTSGRTSLLLHYKLCSYYLNTVFLIYIYFFFFEKIIDDKF